MGKIKEFCLSTPELVQCAITATNACQWAYLTTSGQVCREEYGFIEDTEDSSEYQTLDLGKLSLKQVARLNRALINFHLNH